MKALRWHGREDVRLEELADPEDRPGHVVIEVSWCGICGTDLHEYLHGPIHLPVDEPHPLTGVTVPLTLGHEFSGRIASVGEGVTRLKVGDRVAGHTVISCGQCHYCRRGEYIRCMDIGFLGLSTDGAFARYISVPDHMPQLLPDSIGDDEAALVEPLAVALRAVRRSGLSAGDSVAVIGAGPIGLMALAAARAAGAGDLFVVETTRTRKDMARVLGAHHVIDPADGDPVEQILALTPEGLGVDVTLECVGLETTIDVAIRALAKGGVAAVAGVFEEPSNINFTELVWAERTLVGSLGFMDEMARGIALMADGRIDASPLITGRVRIDDAIEDGFLELIRHKDEHVKILIDPSGQRATASTSAEVAAAA